MFGTETNNVGNGSKFAALFATPTLAALLTIFVAHPEHHFMQKELVAASGSSLYLVQRELKRLEIAGLISRRTRGRQVEYWANTTHPAFAGLKSALMNTLGLGDRLREVLRDIEGISLAFVFGSVASGAEGPESDLDLFVVGEVGLRELAERVMPVVRDLGREPNIVALTAEELCKRVQSDQNFVRTVIEGQKLWLVGDDGQLAAILE